MDIPYGFARLARLPLLGLALLVVGCPKQPAAGPDPPALLVDAAFFETYLAGLEPPPGEQAELDQDLVQWLGREDPEAWLRLEASVHEAFAVPAARLRPALRTSCQQGGAELHTRAVAETDADTATELYRRAALCVPTNADYVNHLATAAANARSWELAERHARLALALDPTFLEAYNRLAHTLKNLGRYEEAVSVAERGLDLDGPLQTKAMLLARQGQAYWLMSREDEAMKSFKNSRRLGGPAWVQSYIDGEQVLGERWRPPAEQ